jgi:hypothetical protein
MPLGPHADIGGDSVAVGWQPESHLERDLRSRRFNSIVTDGKVRSQLPVAGINRQEERDGSCLVSTLSGATTGRLKCRPTHTGQETGNVSSNQPNPA